MRGEGVGYTEFGGELRAIKAGTEDPDGDVQTCAGNGLDGLAEADGFEVTLQFENFIFEILGARLVATEGESGFLICAWGAAETEIDSAGEERFEGAELLGDDERRVVRLHDSAGADADGFCAAGDVGDGDGATLRHR